MKLILVGLDASVRAEGVLDAAVDLARRTGNKLVLFRAVSIPHEIPVEAYTMSPASLVELLENDASRYLDDVSARVPPELLADRVMHIGVPWQGICDTADRLHAGLIVIGAHGYSGLDRVLGTTAAKVVNHAKQSVLVVRGRLSD
jgi:nucleotide-binding universal stress UspA family protein